MLRVRLRGDFTRLDVDKGRGGGKTGGSRRDGRIYSLSHKILLSPVAEKQGGVVFCDTAPKIIRRRIETS